MKKIILIILVLTSLNTMWAQTTSVSSSVSSSKSSYTTISKSETNHKYNYTAGFNKSYTEKVKKAIGEILGKPIEKTNRTTYWEGSGYNVQLRQGKVKIEMEKEETTKSFQLKIQDLSDHISEILDSKDAPQPPRPPKTPRQE